MRANSHPSTCASVRASSVLATPGTPSISACCRARITISARVDHIVLPENHFAHFRRALRPAACSCSSLSVMCGFSDQYLDAAPIRRDRFAFAELGFLPLRAWPRCSRRADLLHSAKQVSSRSFRAMPRCSSAVMPSMRIATGDGVVRPHAPRRKKTRRAAPQEQSRDKRQHSDPALQMIFPHQLRHASGFDYAEMIFVER